MEFVNHTRYPCKLYRTSLVGDDRAACPIVRITYDIVGDQLKIADEQVWEVSFEPFRETEYGQLESDFVFVRENVDLFVLGNAYAPDGQPTEQMSVVVKVNEEPIKEIMVFGDRKWKKGLLGLEKSRPEPFTVMPLKLEHAYGGKEKWDGLDVPYMNNPDGKGYYLHKESAVNGPLPNLEDPNQLIDSWKDCPDPVATTFCPLNGLRILAGVEFDPETNELIKIKRNLFNQAFPGMMVHELHPGDRLVIDRVLPKGKSLEVEMPGLPVYIDLFLGEKQVKRQPFIDQVGLIPERGQVFVTYRYPFRYSFIPEQIRQIELHTTI